MILKKLSEESPSFESLPLGSQIFLSRMLFPTLEAHGLPKIEYWREVMCQYPDGDETTSMGPLKWLDDRKGLRKWWRLMGIELSASVHKQILKITRQKIRDIFEEKKALLAKYGRPSEYLLGYYHFNAVFPTLKAAEKELQEGIWVIERGIDTGDSILKAHTATLRWQEWGW